MPNRPSPVRVGLFGFLGPGNSGNEASMETVLSYLRGHHPDAVIDAMSDGVEQVRAKHGIDAVPLFSDMDNDRPRHGLTGNILKITGKAADIIGTISWVRRHDVMIVPGAGVLEATTPLRAYGFPLSIFVFSAAGRLFGVKVALVSVGASRINQRAVRWLSNGAARCASYRSYRDVHSISAMRQRGIDTSKDRVFTDLAFAFPVPPYEPGDPLLVGVGVMDYYGGNDDRARADEIHSSYVAKIKLFIEWLIDNGYSVRLFGGDGRVDYIIAEDILADIYSRHPDLTPTRIVVDTYSSYSELLSKMNHVGTVVATRYHNVLGGIRLCKPTIALAYSEKFMTLMESMEAAEYCQRADSLDVGLLVQEFKQLQIQRASLRETMAKHNLANAEVLTEQFALLSSLLFPVK